MATEVDMNLRIIAKDEEIAAKDAEILVQRADLAQAERERTVDQRTIQELSSDKSRLKQQLEEKESDQDGKDDRVLKLENKLQMLKLLSSTFLQEVGEIVSGETRTERGSTAGG